MDSSDIYQAPATTPVEQEPSDAGQTLYIVSPNKFSLLFISTLGLYEVYWQYCNWYWLKQNRGLKVRPILRALFSLFFFGSLLRHVNKELGDDKKANHLPVVPMTSLYIVVALVSQGADNVAARTETYSVIDFISLALLPVTWLLLLSTQRAINLSQNDPDGESNSVITWANSLWIFLGILLWVALLAGISGYIAPEIWI